MVVVVNDLARHLNPSERDEVFIQVIHKQNGSMRAYRAREPHAYDGAE